MPVLELFGSEIMPIKANCIGGRSEPPAIAGGHQLTPWIVGKGGGVALETGQWPIIPDESADPWRGSEGDGARGAGWIDLLAKG